MSEEHKPYRCIKPHCPTDCSMCNHAIPGEPSAKLLIVELLDAFAKDGHGGDFEDGECELVDRARAYVSATPAAPASAPSEGIHSPFNACMFREECRARALAPTAPALPEGVVESVAEAIYDQWLSVPGYVPWVKGGNSMKQDDARAIARKALTTPEPGEEGGRSE